MYDLNKNKSLVQIERLTLTEAISKKIPFDRIATFFNSKSDNLRNCFNHDEFNRKCARNANAIGTEGESYSKLPKLFEIIER